MKINHFTNSLFLLFTFLFITSCSNPKEEKPVAEKQNKQKSFWVGDTTSHIHGIDVSHHQKDIDWTKVKEQGVTFVFVKATEGVDYLDTMFVKNWKDLEEENMIRGAYHFYVSDDDPLEQAEWFVKNIGSFEGILPPVMDVERAGHDHITPEAYREKLVKCLGHVEKLTGQLPILYSSPNFAKKYLASDEFGKYKLWIAEYGVEQPTIPNAWQKPGWDFWQNTYQDKVPGVPVEVDRNIFKGNYRNLVDMVSWE